MRREKKSTSITLRVEPYIKDWLIKNSNKTGESVSNLIGIIIKDTNMHGDMRVIYTQGEYRIIELCDKYADIDDLKGDTYNPKVNIDIDPKQLLKEEREFERLVDSSGVFGYALERWNTDIGQGWNTVDSCFGFVGMYDSKVELYNHYIIDEFKAQIK